MKFVRRRVTADPSPTEPPTPAPEPVDAAPPGRPAAVFAGVLDGRHLWVAVAERPGTFALRGTDGELLAVPDATPDGVPDDQPGFLGARLDLSALDPARAPYAVVVVPPGNGTPAAVWTPPLPTHRRSPAVGGVHRSLGRADDGTLQVRLVAAPDGIDVLAVHATTGALHVTLDQADGATVEAVVKGGDAVLASWPVVDGAVALTTTPLDDAGPQPLRLVARTPDGVRPLRRRADDLATPARSVPLPHLYAPGGDEPRLRLRWTPDATLMLRVLDTATAGSDDGEDAS